MAHPPREGGFTGQPGGGHKVEGRAGCLDRAWGCGGDGGPVWVSHWGLQGLTASTCLRQTPCSWPLRALAMVFLPWGMREGRAGRKAEV